MTPQIVEAIKVTQLETWNGEEQLVYKNLIQRIAKDPPGLVRVSEARQRRAPTYFNSKLEPSISSKADIKS